MTCSQYKNIIKWTLANSTPDDAADSVATARAIFKNCGVAFPNGNIMDILLTLMSEKYMGWVSCTCAQAQEFANTGVATVGVDADQIVVVAPEEKVIITDNAIAVTDSVDNFIQPASSIEPVDRMQMQFFAYASSSTTTQTPLERLRNKFPNGRFWNHYYNKGSSNSVNNQDGTTDKPCDKHGVVGTSEQQCNGFVPSGSSNQLSWQCMGFAEKCGYDVTGYNPRVNADGWNTSYLSSAVDSVKPGDIVRYKNDGHSIYVTGVSGSTVTYGDCNGTGRYCEIRWGATIDKTTLKSSFTHLRSAPWTAY